MEKFLHWRDKKGYPRKTVCIIEDPETGILFFGIARCNKREKTVLRKRGLEVSRGRALRTMKDYKHCKEKCAPHPEDYLYMQFGLCVGNDLMSGHTFFKDIDRTVYKKEQAQNIFNYLTKVDEIMKNFIREKS